MAKDESVAAQQPDSVAETRRFERENTDPTIPFDGAEPRNIAGPASNVEMEIAAQKRAAAAGQLSTRLRPEHAQVKSDSGDAITDSDVNAAPSAGLNVAEDSGKEARQEAQEELGVVGRTSTPPKRQTTSDSKPKS